jgi:hypothetical protein
MKTFLKMAAILFGTALTTCAQSVPTYQVTYSLDPENNAGVNKYTYTYSVINNFGSDLTGFEIFFPDIVSNDAFLFTLTSWTHPLGWVGSVSLPHAEHLSNPPITVTFGGGLRFEAISGTVISSHSLSEFTATFEYSSPNNPPLGSQEYILYDRNWRSVTDLGDRTTPARVTSVPDQANWLTFLLAGAALAFFAQRYQASPKPAFAKA